MLSPNDLMPYPCRCPACESQRDLDRQTAVADTRGRERCDCGQPAERIVTETDMEGYVLSIRAVCASCLCR